jgi:hypothetical protein
MDADLILKDGIHEVRLILFKCKFFCERRYTFCIVLVGLIFRI